MIFFKHQLIIHYDALYIGNGNQMLSIIDSLTILEINN